MFLFGKYRGTKESPKSAWAIAPSLGIASKIKKNIYLRAGYKYFNDQVETISDHKFFVNFTLLLSR
jgi:hypothetical protein